MEVFAVITGIASLISLGLAVYAVNKSISVEHAVQGVIDTRNSHEDLQRLTELLRVLGLAKDAARVWVDGAPDEGKQGRNHDHDLSKISDAIDALRTRAPIEMEEAMEAYIHQSSESLQASYNEIVDPNINENRWQNVLSEIQSLIKNLEKEERSRGNMQLIATTN